VWVSNAREQQPASRRSIGARSAVLAGALLLAGTLTAAVTVAAHASRTRADSKVRLELAYTCAFPSATGGAATPTPVGVTITAHFPGVATAGRRVQPSKVRMTLDLPPAAVAALRELGGTSVSSTTFLSVEVSQQATKLTRWQGQAPDQPVPTTGGITIVAPGQATAVPVTSPRTIRFTAADLTLVLQLTGTASASPSTASGSSASPGSASGSSVSPSPSPSPSSAASVSAGPVTKGSAGLRVACTPASGRSATLAAIPVVAASASRNTPARRPRNRLPKDCGHIKVRGTGIPVCGYITGYSDVTKLYGAALLQPKRPAKPALVNIDFAYRHVFKPGRLVEYSTGELYYQGHRELPPVRVTFLAFRFVPVTATLMVTELTPIAIRSVSGISGLPYPLTLSATTRVAIRISDVDVNGVPLAIGPHCRPVSTTRLTLTGQGDNTVPPRGYTLATGGPLTGRLTIPAFTDCGVTENLDPLLTGSISGPGNYTLMTQGKLCGPSQPQDWTCPPPVPKPIH
jgi:hypothetical protein